MPPILRKETLQICHELDKIHTPYIFIDTFIDQTNCISSIGEDAFQGGRVAASLVDFGLPPDKDILMVNIAKDLENTHHLNKRNQGFMSYFLDAVKNQELELCHQTTVNTGAQVRETIFILPKSRYRSFRQPQKITAGCWTGITRPNLL